MAQLLCVVSQYPLPSTAEVGLGHFSPLGRISRSYLLLYDRDISVTSWACIRDISLWSLFLL